MRIDELFDRKYPYKWIHRSNDQWLAELKTKTREYHISIRKDDMFVNDDNEPVIFWDLGFAPTDNSLAGDDLMSSGGEEFKIFSSVLHAYREFIETVKPEMFSFSAHVKLPKRARLYRRIFNKFADRVKDLGYKEVVCPRYPDPNIDKRLRQDYVSVCLQRK